MPAVKRKYQKKRKAKEQPAGPPLLSGIQSTADASGGEQVTVLCGNDWLCLKDERLQNRLQPFEQMIHYLQEQKPSPQVTQHLKKNEWDVENIKGVKWDKKGIHYLVKWEGCDSSGKSWDNSWEPAKNMLCPDLLQPFQPMVEWLKHNSSPYWMKRIKRTENLDPESTSNEESSKMDAEPDAEPVLSEKNTDRIGSDNKEAESDSSNDSGLPGDEKLEEEEKPAEEQEQEEQGEAVQEEQEDDDDVDEGPVGDHLRYYQILGVPHDAPVSLIHSAFRKLAKAFHPDWHVGAPETIRRQKEVCFKMLNVAKTVLVDPEKRSVYDDGDDPHQTIPQSQ